LWLDDGSRIGVEGRGFFLGEQSVSSAVASDATGTPLLARPVVNALTGQEAVSFVAFPGALSGGVTVSSRDELWGAEANFLGSLVRAKCFSADMIVGFRYVGLDESLSVSSNTTVLGPAAAVAFNGNLVGLGNTVTIVDHFETRNDFYGGQVGGRVEFHYCGLYVDLRGTLAIGNAHEVVQVSGNTSLTGPGLTPQTLPGGLLAVASNSGRSTRDEFTFIPEANVRAGYQLTEHLSAFVGYTFLYWFDTLRPGNQIDRTVNPNLVPSNLSFGTPTTVARPLVPFQKSDFWAQGINFGVEFRY
jgi:hypothetical protein